MLDWLNAFARRCLDMAISKARLPPFAPNSTKAALRQISEMKAPSKPPVTRQSPKVGEKIRDVKAKRAKSAEFWGTTPVKTFSQASVRGRRI